MLSPSELPSRSLEDQVYIAYAHDDIHTAKILLLKLKGIQVTSDDDPRIAAVQDEDFDFCFIPNGKLISEEEEKAMMEAQRREQKRRQREERFRACEYKWDHAKRRMREERLWLQRRRELEERKQAAEEAERQRVMVARPQLQRRHVVSYDTLSRSSSSSPCDESFVYDVMPSSTHSTPSSSPRRSQLSTPSSSPPKHCHSSHLQATKPIFDDHRAVPFKLVVQSLEGPLFPVTIEERQRRMSISERSKSRSRTKDRYRQRQDVLLDSLLSVIEWEDLERRLRKGKVVSKSCRRCSIDMPSLSISASSSSVSSCPSLTRSSSWLSFVSDTTPPSIPPLIPTWLKRSKCSPCCAACRQHSRRVLVPLCDTPLHSGAVMNTVDLRRDEKRSPNARRQSLVGAVNVVVQGFGQFLEVAKQFQRAYMMAAVYNGAELNNSDGETDNYSYWHQQHLLIPPGRRAHSRDVKAFLASSTPTSPLEESTAQYIPLISPFPPEYPPRTVLPNPLPYPIVFKPHPPVSRSPFRPHSHHHTGDPRSPHYGANLRVRLVSNPVYLRLKALRNLTYERGVNWEAGGRDCGFSSGKETLPTIAVDGLGRSFLSVC